MASKVKLIFLLLFLVGCGRYNQSQELSRVLQKAVNERHLSAKKIPEIVKEFEKIGDEELSRQYLDRIAVIIEMGGDSTHIDAARKSMREKRKHNSKK